MRRRKTVNLAANLLQYNKQTQKSAKLVTIEKTVKIVSEYDQEISQSQQQTNSWCHKEEPHNNHEALGRQTKQGSQLYLPHQDECYCCYFCHKRPSNSLGHMETRPRLKVSSDRLVKPGIEPTTPGLQGEQFIHKTTAAPIKMIEKLESTQKLTTKHRNYRPPTKTVSSKCGCRSRLFAPSNSSGYFVCLI